MRALTVTLTVLVLGAVLIASRQPGARRPAAAQDDAGPTTVWFKIVFGHDGEDAAWDGNVRVSGGELIDIVPWSFEARDQLDVDAASWKIRTGLIAGRRVTYAEPTRGLLLKVQHDAGTRVEITTKQGTVAFAPATLTGGRPQSFLDDRVTVEVLGTEAVVAESSTDDDFPSIAVDSRGHRLVLWQAFDEVAQKDHLLFRDVDDPESMPESVFDASEFSSPHLFVRTWLGNESPVAIFCSPGTGNDWNIYAATKRGARWSPRQLSTASGSDIFLDASQSRDGSIWITWQSQRDGNADVFARRYNSEWSPEIRITAAASDEWEPSISAVSRNAAWIAYDTYANGNYDVVAKQIVWKDDSPRVEDPVVVTSSPDFEAHASILADGDNVWVAYDAAGPGWGKDFKSGATMADGVYSEPLHASRRIEVKLIRDGKLFEPVKPLPQILPPDRIHMIERSAKAKPSRFYEYPQLGRDGDGRLWLTFRMCRQGYCAHPPMGIDWRNYATTFTGNGWLEPIELPLSQGRQNQRLAFARGVDGRLEFAWADGNRFASVNRKYVVRHGRLPDIADKAAEIEVEPVSLETPGTPIPEPEVRLTMHKGGRQYRVLFGDLHRHTNISRCMPTIDGCLDDAHRYALNAVEYDFLAVTDHTRDVDPFSWWRTQKAADWFRIPGRYIPIYAYERSNGTAGGGHRNVFFIKRGATVNPGDAWGDGVRRQKPDTDPTTTLYPWMKKRGDALTAAHTPGYSAKEGKGTWTYHDPQMEPIAEIFQGFRKSYERPGNGVAEQASLWHALKKGYRLGFIASSDHMSTHMSFACVWAEEKTRESIFEALSARRTYAATDRIGLAMSIGDALMGEATTLRDRDVTLDIRVEGTSPVEQIEIVRSGRVISTIEKPDGGRLVTIDFTDPAPLDGRSHYYVRLVQENGAIAWGSPIWVDR